MAYDFVTVTRTDSTTFDALSPSGQLTQTTDSDGVIQLALDAVGWGYFYGTQPSIKSGDVAGTSSASEVLVQVFAGTGGGPTKTRYLLVTSTGIFTVTDGTTSVTIAQGHFVDVVNSVPPSFGTSHVFSPSMQSQTYQTLTLAKAQYQIQKPI